MFALQNLFLRNSELFLKVRLFIYCLTFAHLNVMAVILLNKDLTSSEDPNLIIYMKLKWKLITTWFNILTIPYIFLCIYCDWRELTKANVPHVKALKNIRDFYFTNLILPATLFPDILFWIIWNTNRELLMPLSVDKYVSLWEQHSMHTASLVFVILDLVLVPRRKPNNHKWGIIILSTYIGTYILVCLQSLFQREYVYPGLKILSTFQLILFGAYCILGHFFFYIGQWFVIDLLWNQKSNVKATD
ncbi:unnamed protein product [Parnassius mnemosyne]|uniref:Androgen-dependent TFPI-regulating protein n=1 Tax=Parnassius mnemosyne TaxID=213953 RepID=A0AAV1M376_9NEOP